MPCLLAYQIYLAAATNQRLVPDPTAYLALCDRFYVNPRGESPTNLSVSPLNTSAIAAAAKADAAVADHPLSQETESTWSRFFVLEDVRELIRKDVSRTFQEDEFFQSSATQDALTRMLCVFTLSKRIAYKQGMHELAAVLFWTTWNEKSGQLPPDHVEATAYTLYEALMVLQAPFFEGDTAVQLSERFFHVHLRAVNDELYLHLTQLGIEPHLFGLRWLRLLFAREYPLPDVAHLWDGLFCLARSYPTAWSDHLAYIAATTLLGIRDLLMHDDYSTAMTATMHARSPLTGPDVILQTVQFRRQFAPVVFDLAQRFDAKRAAAANAPIRPRTQSGPRVATSPTSSTGAGAGLPRRKSLQGPHALGAPVGKTLGGGTPMSPPKAPGPVGAALVAAVGARGSLKALLSSSSAALADGAAVLAAGLGVRDSGEPEGRELRDLKG
ncbi:TBC1 domain, member 5 [Allomyces arbusculus]|nr:TBC1 domain, member 5 [Allomyces arbusculus]